MSEEKKDLMKRLYYMSTFDGGVYYGKRTAGSNPRFILNMRAANRDYIEYVQRTLEEVCGTTLKERGDYNTDGYIRVPQLRLESQNHPVFKKIHERIYIDGHKVIDPHMLTLLDAEALAIIFMADGSACADKVKWTNVTLNTKGFSYGDNFLLKKALKDLLNLEFNINRQNSYYYLRLRTKDHRAFYDLLVPYVLPSFFYKLERLAPQEEGGDIVRSLQECRDPGRNDQGRQDLTTNN